MTKTMTRGAWARIVLYVLTALVGLAAAVLPLVGLQEHVPVLTSITGLLALLSGGTATYNVPAAPDQAQRTDLGAVIRQIGVLVATLRDTQPIAPAPHQPATDVGLPVYDGPTTAQE